MQISPRSCTCPRVWHGIYPPPPCPVCQGRHLSGWGDYWYPRWPHWGTVRITEVSTTTETVTNSPKRDKPKGTAMRAEDV